MGYNMENFRKIREEYKEKYKKAEEKQILRLFGLKCIRVLEYSFENVGHIFI